MAVNGFEAFSSELAQAGELQLMGFEASHTKKSSRSIPRYSRYGGKKASVFVSDDKKISVSLV